MAKFHLSPGSGNPALCHASVRGCPLGADDTDHYDNPELAREAFEKKNYKNLFAVQKKMTPTRRNEELYKDKAIEFQARLENIQDNGKFTKIVGNEDEGSALEDLNDELQYALKNNFDQDAMDMVMTNVSSSIQQMRSSIPNSHITYLNIGNHAGSIPDDFSNEDEAQAIIYKMDRQIESLEKHNGLKNPYEEDANYKKIEAPKTVAAQLWNSPTPSANASATGGGSKKPPTNNKTAVATPDPDNNNDSSKDAINAAANKSQDNVKAPKDTTPPAATPAAAPTPKEKPKETHNVTSNTSPTPPAAPKKPAAIHQFSRDNSVKTNLALSDYRKRMGMEERNINPNSYKTHAQVKSVTVSVLKRTVDEAYRKGEISSLDKTQLERRIDRANNIKSASKENVARFHQMSLQVANELSDRTESRKVQKVQAAQRAVKASEGRRISYNDKNISSLTGSTSKERYDFIKKHSGSRYVSGMYSGNYYNTYETDKGTITLDHSGKDSVTFKVNGKHFIMKYDQRGNLGEAKQYTPW